MDDLIARAQAWLAHDPDPDTRAELQELIDHHPHELARRFSGRLQFGTAGLRGPLGAGPMAMNRVLVRQAAAGLVHYLLDTIPDSRQRGIVIGYDARHKSDVFALDTACVAAAAGVRALLLPRALPTPVLAYSIRHLGAAAGVMVTASHNPPADNGYKVYLGESAQIVPPADVDISARIEAVTDPVALADPGHPLIERLDDAPIEAYLAHVPSVRLVPSATDVRVAYTPLHGVGGAVLRAAFSRAELPEPAVVAEQAEPDGDFPTVAFPNPEEPGAIDRLLALARAIDADVALANDPDADRLAVAVPIPGSGTGGAWRALRGDEVGWLLADHILRHTSGDDRLVITTLVSSSLLASMAAAAGVHYAETFTGFKWIGRYVLDHPDLRFVFGYEQALGYLVAGLPLDKDGITAAVLMAEVVADAKAAGLTLLDRLADIERRFGRHVVAERSIPIDPARGAGLVEALRAAPPSSLGGQTVTAVTDYAAANLLRFQCGSALRVQVRPSGTEPKVKLYGEGIDLDPAAALDDLARLIS